MNKVILMKVTSRERPEQLLKTVNAYLELANNPVAMTWLFTLDEDDIRSGPVIIPKIIDLFDQKGLMTGLIKFRIGDSKNKIDAINRDVSGHDSPWDILLNISDDQHPIVKGYDDKIRNAMPDDLDASLWFFDGAQPRLNTQEIVGRNYYNRFGYIYHPDYKSLFCDNEAHDVAVKLGKQIKSEECIIKHFHPACVPGIKSDELYKKNEGFWHQDQNVYESRKRQNFDLTILSILICSLEKRKEFLDALIAHLQKQISAVPFAAMQVQILFSVDNKEHSTGNKRNSLLNAAKGKYVVFIDDDDEVPEYYVQEMLTACKSDCDCIAINGWMTTNGIGKINWRLSKDYQNMTIKENGVELYLRKTNHITAVKREHALKAGFPNISNAEDKAYSEAVNKFLTTEYTIEKPMYHYKYLTTNK